MAWVQPAWAGSGGSDSLRSRRRSRSVRCPHASSQAIASFARWSRVIDPAPNWVRGDGAPEISSLPMCRYAFWIV